MRCGLFATKDRVEVKRDRLLEELDCYKLKSKKLKTLTVQKDAAMNAKSASLLAMKKK